MTIRWGSLVSTAALTVLLLTGCDDAPEPAPRPSPSGSPPSSSPPASPRAVAEKKAVAAYNALWQATAKAAEVPDPDAPELRRYASGDALALLVGTLLGYRETGFVTKGRPVNRPVVVSAAPAAAPTEVKLTDCGDDRAWRKYTKDGRPVDDEPGGFRRITATVSATSGSWKVTTFAAGDLGSC